MKFSLTQKKITYFFFISCILLQTSYIAKAQTKKPLSHDVYDDWKSIQGRAISNDGKWVIYSLTPQEGDANLMIHDISKKENKPTKIARGTNGIITEDSKYVVFSVKPFLDSLKNQRRRKVKEENLMKDSLGIFDLMKDTLTLIPHVKSFKTPKKASGWVAFQLEQDNVSKKTAAKDTSKIAKDSLKIKNPKPEIKEIKDKKDDKKKDRKDKEIKEIKEPKTIEIDTVRLEEPTPLEKAEQEILALKTQLEKIEQAKKAEEAKKKADKSKKPPKKEGKDTGTRLILRNLQTAKQDTFLFVTDYLFDEKGTKLGFVSTGNDSTFKAGVYVYDLNNGRLQHIFDKAGKHKNLIFDTAGEQMSFVADTDTTKKNAKALIRYFDLYYWASGQKTTNLLADKNTSGIPKTWLINEHYALNFSKDGSRLFFGTNPTPIIKDTTLLPEEIVNVDVWNWKDTKLQPQQLVQLQNELKRAYLAVAYPKARRIYQLADKEVPNVIINPETNADFFLGFTTEPYETTSSWEGFADRDIYLINTKDGKKRKIKDKLRANAAISPNGNYLYWYAEKDSTWQTYSTRSGQFYNLTKSIKNKFYDELNDSPDYPNAYGSAGWTENDATFLIYDRYDVWAFDPENRKPAQRITQNGRENKIEFRYIRLDPEEKFINSKNPVLWHAFDEETKAEGYFSQNINAGEAPRKLIFRDNKFGYPIKAKNAERYVFTMETFSDYPNLQHSDNTFTKINQISNANPQQSNYFWGSVELVKWTSLNGEELQGLLYKPEGFDEGKKYPMITYFYERLSDDLHTYHDPAPIRSALNRSLYVSNGYLIFIPDIPYKIGYPGQSAYDAIISGVSHLLNKGFVDRDKLGVQGHSWGGYQTAYLITKTDLFAVAVSGAPVVNMTSAYGGIRWETGISRMFQYEHTQSRIGATLWEKPLLYLENSPLFAAENVRTPLLMMHNDKDGAVPWYQGIEFFMALKRLNQPVWMLNYNGEAHGLIERKNRRDYAIRMMQFFDYYLKYAPEPYWMKKGVPATEKGINMRYELGEK